MVKLGRIIKITSAPLFKHQLWWVMLNVVDENKREYSTFVTARTKIDVIKKAKLDREISFVA